MTTGGQDRSDAELRDEVIAGWQHLVNSVEPSDNPLRALKDRTGIPIPQLDMARHVRNEIAHPNPNQPVPRERLLKARQTIAEAEQWLKTRKPTPDKSGRQTTRTARRQVVDPTPPEHYPAVGSRRPPLRRLSLRQPLPRRTVPHDQAGEPAQHDDAKHRAGPRHLVFHSTAGERSAPQLIPLSQLGLSSHAARVTCDVPWLYGAIIGDSVSLIAGPLEPHGMHCGSAQVDSQDGSVTITVDAYTPPLPRKTHPAMPTSYRDPIRVTIRDEIRDGVAAAVYVALVVGGLILLMLLAGRLA